MTPTRPALRYFGGKWMLARWIIDHLPPHRIYVEPFGGAGSVLLRKPRAYAEIYNDLDDEVVSLFRILRDRDQSVELRRQLVLTPFARSEFRAAYAETNCEMERARRLVVRSFMGHGVTSWRRDRVTGFRSKSMASGRVASRDWQNLPDALEALTIRMAGVQIENLPASDLIETYINAADACLYIDPPYVHATRSSKRCRGALNSGYHHELSDQDHEALLRQLKRAAGGVVVSGYQSDLYQDLVGGWVRVDREAMADGARVRTESLWINPPAASALGLAA